MRNEKDQRAWDWAADMVDQQDGSASFDDEDENALTTVIEGIEKHHEGDELLAVDDEGVIRHRDETPLVCRGCNVRRTWRNAGHRCTICYKSYGHRH
eukprot:12465018-Heterocapsa_arctica.AAC.1